MIAHYQTPAAIALLDKIGRPEWREGEYVRRLFPQADAAWPIRLWIERHGGFWSNLCSVADHVALCLLRNHLREYAERADVWMDARINQADTVEYFVYDNRSGTDQGDDCLVDSFLDYDEALLAAAHAVMEQ